MYYILNEEGEPVEERNITRWALWFEKAAEKRTIANTTIGDICISTVFLGLDHSYGRGSPLLYETMIFGGEHHGYQTRCGTKASALMMHQEAVKFAKEKICRLETKLRNSSGE